MSPLQAIVLGVVQGVTEFLPISSSAHLILGSKLFGWPDQGLHFDMAVNSGSLVAMLVYLRHELADLVRGLLDALRGRATARRRAALQVAVATLPVGALGVVAQPFVAGGGRELWVLGATSLVFGLLLGWADRRPAVAAESGWTWRQALWVGLGQALAVIPGTSRSGVTMTAGLFAGMTREAATRLSFVLAVPVGLLVAMKDVWDLTSAPAAVEVPLASLWIGTVAAALSAYLAIHWLLRWVRRHGFAPFAIYRVALGIVLLLLAAA
jgi:undecaprenyl-diphosphatase